MNSGLTSHQQQGHKETGPWFKVSSEKWRIMSPAFSGIASHQCFKFHLISLHSFREVGIHLAIPGLVHFQDDSEW